MIDTATDQMTATRGKHKKQFRVRVQAFARKRSLFFLGA